MANAPCAAPQSTAHCGPFACQEAVDQSGGEGITPAHAIENLQILPVACFIEFGRPRKQIAPQSFTLAVFALRSVVAMI